METGSLSLTNRMFDQVARWRVQDDPRCIFLECYGTMTANMLAAVAAGRFHDPGWVTVLLHRFADYYFVALDSFEQNDPATPAVWRQAHTFNRKGGLHTLQHLFLGINAHINYDLVFAEADMLEREWSALSLADKRTRYEDHCLVNQVITETIDTVQDQVVEQHYPFMNIVDFALGRLDERTIGALISRWREEVWDQTTEYVIAPPAMRLRQKKLIEEKVLRRGARLLFERG